LFDHELVPGLAVDALVITCLLSLMSIPPVLLLGQYLDGLGRNVTQVNEWWKSATEDSNPCGRIYR
jgi:hypothetical protein